MEQNGADFPSLSHVVQGEAAGFEGLGVDEL